MNLRIRPGAPGDSPALCSLARRAKASWGYPDEWLEEWRPDLEITPAYVDHHHVLVAETEGRLVGVVALEVAEGSASLEHAWVDPSCQGRGVGGALVRRALADAPSLGCAVVDVVSDPNARAFYEHLGGRVIGDLPAPMPGAPERTLPVLRFTLPGGPPGPPAS